MSLLLLSTQSLALEEFVVEIKNHLFIPSALYIPENKKVKLTFYNRDNTPEELDSFDLNREKVIFANSKASVYIGPLPKGRYNFFGEFNPSLAVGIVYVVSEQELNDVNQ